MRPKFRLLRGPARLLLSAVLFLVNAALIVFVTLVLAGAFAARQRADLETWHTEILAGEFRAGDGTSTLEDYLDREQRLFDELEEKVISRVELDASTELNRYARGSRSFPERSDRNWNRTQILRPSEIRGGVLMLHGMTDSPYSLRHYGELFRDRGFYVLNLRMPGHGTIPGELARVSWRDWDAAVMVGAEHVSSMLGPDQPFYILGYSNGGSLALKYTLESLENFDLRIPDRLFLISPMLGVSGLARFSRIYYWLGRIGFFEKAYWLDLFPEYDPHKYNSFPMNGPMQSKAITDVVSQGIRRLAKSGALDIMPPVLTFQSLVDNTVITRDVVARLYDHLPANGSELVLFDINREGVLDQFVVPARNRLLAGLKEAETLGYALTIITNENSNTLEVRELSKRPYRAEFRSRPLGLSWPENFYSLSHVALPFPPDDEIYGFMGVEPGSGFPPLGRVQMVGESGALVLPASVFTRARSNPFHSYVVRRLGEQIE